jgi:hypothetical protein
MTVVIATTGVRRGADYCHDPRSIQKVYAIVTGAHRALEIQYPHYGSQLDHNNVHNHVTSIIAQITSITIGFRATMATTIASSNNGSLALHQSHMSIHAN